MADMITQIKTVPYKKINLRKTSAKLDDLFIIYNNEYIPAKEFQIITKKKIVDRHEVIEETKDIKSVEELNKNLHKLCYKNEADMFEYVQKVDSVYVENVPKTYDSNTINAKLEASDSNEDKKNKVVDAGLRRKLSVKEASGSSDDNYLYVEIEDEKKFLKKSEIFWVDGSEIKNYNEIPTGVDPSTVKFVDEHNQQISTIYSGREFYFEYVVAKESVDLKGFTKSSYTTTDGNHYSQTAQKLNRTLSEQEFFTTEEIVGKKKKRAKLTHFVKTKNYQYNENGEFVALIFDGKIQVVPISKLETEDGKAVEDINTMIGLKLNLVEYKDEKKEIVATSEPLTYEQTKLRYNTVKTYQSVEGDATENTCLRLANGNYVKELQSVQPISYKLAEDPDSFDAYLIQEVVGDKVSYVVVDKDFFKKKGKVKRFDNTKIIKVNRCDINDKNCVAVQKTSNNEEIEECDVVKDFEIDLPKSDGTKEKHNFNKQREKSDCYKDFLEGYKAGIYKISDIYINGKREDLAKNSGRYDYTDESIREVDNRLAESSKYETGKKISSSFKKFTKNIKKTCGFAILAAAIPGIGPLITAAYAASVLVAIPSIPAWHIANGAIRNTFMSKESRSKDNIKQYNNENVKQIIQEISNLNNLVNSGKITNQIQFEDAFATHIMDRILALSATTRTNAKGENLINEDPRFEALLNQAASLKLFTYLTKFKDSEFTNNNLSELKPYTDRIGYNAGLTIDGIYIFANNKQLKKVFKKKFKKDPNKKYEWYDLRDKVLNSLNLIKASQAEMPQVYEVENVMAKIAEIENLYVAFYQISDEIKALSSSVFEKDYYLSSLNELTVKVEEVYNESKTNTDSDELDEIIEKIKNNKTKADEIKNNIKQQLAISDRQLLISAVDEYYTLATEKLNSLEGNKLYESFSDSYVKNLKLCNTIIKDIGEDVSNTEIDIKQAVALKEKAHFIYKISEVGADFLVVLEKFEQLMPLESLEDLGITQDMMRLIKADKNSSIAQLDEQYRLAKAFYDGLLYKLREQENKQEKAKKEEEAARKKAENKETKEKGVAKDKTKTPKKLNDNIVVTENAIIRELEDFESETYKYILRLLMTSKNFKLSLDEAKKAIYDFTDQANLAHNEHKYAKDIFEKGSAGEYILRKSKLQLGKAVTLQL